MIAAELAILEANIITLSNIDLSNYIQKLESMLRKRVSHAKAQLLNGNLKRATQLTSECYMIQYALNVSENTLANRDKIGLYLS